MIKRRNPIYPNLGNNTEKWKLDYLRQHAETMSARQIHEATGLSDSFIYYYCELKNIPLKKVTRNGHVHIPVPYHRNYEAPVRPDPPANWKRPPAVYDNESHEQVLTRWENTDI